MPTIIPISTPTKIDCITSSGKTYCEKQELTSEDKIMFGYLLLGLVIWIAVLIYLIEKPLNSGLLIVAWGLSPFLIMAAFLIF